MPRQQPARWTPTEDEILVLLRRHGETVTAIALQLRRRTWSAVHQRIRFYELDGTIPQMSVAWDKRQKVQSP